ncbi:MAG TPA: hypothetical protein DD620_02615 [Verrucomicrobia bacterium]|nr:hypothetical protein [Kiritimatiellaceae bacterium]HBO87627.1 hypothetical protein [Verrucomicrobiota bacterium]
MSRAFGIMGATWGVIGITLLLGRGLVCLVPYVLELADSVLTGWQGTALLSSVILLGYTEGYKGFQLRFSPRAAARVNVVRRIPTLTRVVLAPLFCMGFFDATRKRKIVAYGLTTMVVLLIILVERLPQPWRGIVDAGVLFGLSWGLVSFWFFTLRVLFGLGPAVDPELS